MAGMRALAFTAFGIVMGLSTGAAAQKTTLDVLIIDRQASESEYSYMIPQASTTEGVARARCSDFASSTNCVASGSSTTVTRPPQQYGYTVKGATLALKLPDARIVVVNCVSKYAPRGDYINRRSCRVPLVNEIRAEFKDDDEKLIWSVSLDGRKQQSETYKVIAVVNPGESK